MIAALVAASCATLLLAGCEKKETARASASDSGKRKIVVGFSQIGADGGWRTANTQSTKDEAAKRGIELVFSDAQQKQENQIKALKSFIVQGADVIAFSPVVATAGSPCSRKSSRRRFPPC